MADGRGSPGTKLVPNRGHPVVHAIDCCVKLSGTAKQKSFQKPLYALLTCVIVL